MPNSNTMMMITNQEIHNLQVDKDHQPIQASQCSRIDTTYAETFVREATINIGIIGHTSHGRSELIQAISEVNKEEKEKEKNSFNMFPGFTNVKIFKCPKCLQPDCYKAYPNTQDDYPLCPNPYCSETLKLVRHVSFVEYPSIEMLMSTMLAGADIIDACLLLVASNTACPQQQTLDHLAAIEMMKLGDKTIILQNNIDLLAGDEKLAMKNLQEIKTFVKGTTAEKAPIIPISAQFRYNIDALCKYICEYIPIPVRDLSSAPEMPIARSFDVNKPETGIDELKGGVVGGRILKGTLKIGDKVEIRPGYVVKDNDNRISHCIPIMSKVVSLSTDNDNLEYAVSGGAIGVELAIDPSLAESSKLAGNVLGLANQLPEVYKEIEVSYYLLHKLLGVKSEASNTRVKNITPGELLMVNIGSSSVSGSVKSVDGQRVKIALISKPVCAKIGEKVTISRRIEQTWRLIGWGVFEDGEALPIVKP